jgi:hypothetical protein
MDDSDKTMVKISPFSGKQSDWNVWKEKFMATLETWNHFNFLGAVIFTQTNLFFVVFKKRSHKKSNIVFVWVTQNFFRTRTPKQIFIPHD